jgi:hypothetical protein
MKIKEVAYNVVLPITGTVRVKEDATDDDIENAIYDDARDAGSYKSTWKSMEVTDIYDLKVM